MDDDWGYHGVSLGIIWCCPSCGTPLSFVDHHIRTGNHGFNGFPTSLGIFTCWDLRVSLSFRLPNVDPSHVWYVWILLKFSSTLTTSTTHLVGGFNPPLWKKLISQFGWWHSQYIYMEKIIHSCSKPPTSNIFPQQSWQHPNCPGLPTVPLRPLGFPNALASRSWLREFNGAKFSKHDV